MALHYAVQGYRTSLAAVVQTILYLRVPMPGTLTRIDVYAGAANSAGAAIFDVNYGLTPETVATLFPISGNRPQIAAGALVGSVTGLTQSVAKDSIITLDLDSPPVGGVTGPIFLVLTIEDGTDRRRVVTLTTTSIAAGAILNTAIPGFGRGWKLLSASADFENWLRLYTKSARRTADAARLITVDPDETAGVCADIIFTPSALTPDWGAPFPEGFNLDDATSTNAIAAIKNTAGVSRVITLTLLVVPLEK